MLNLNKLNQTNSLLGNDLNDASQRGILKNQSASFFAQSGEPLRQDVLTNLSAAVQSVEAKTLSRVSAVNAVKGTEEQIRAVQGRLQELGYWITNVDGKKGPETDQAIIAFRKVQGLERNANITPTLLEALQKAERPKPAAIKNGVEVDLTRQVLYIVKDGKVDRILAVSTGSGETYASRGKKQLAYTPVGKFQINRKIEGVRDAPLGRLYNPLYFKEGWAIHGSNSVPTFPASHGCVRVPRFADKALFKQLPVGTTVYIHK